jgi:hypothetical protein
MPLFFKGLTETIQEQISKTVQEHVHPPISQEAIYFNQDSRYNTPTIDNSIKGVFKWGVSIWGIDPIIGKDFPDE